MWILVRIVQFGWDCENLSRTVNHLLYCMRSFHLKAAHVSNSASKSQLLLLQTKFFWFSQNFILVQQKCDTKCKRWEEVGEVEDTLKIDIFLKFEIFLKFDFFLKFDIFIKFDMFVKFEIWYFYQK